VAIAGLIALAIAVWVGHVTASDEGRRVSAATVRITTISSKPDYSKPWQSKGTETSTGSGAIIAGQRILTNAHVVACAASIEVKRPGIQKSFLAKVEHIDHGCDLALLTVEDRAFFDGVAPLELGTLPTLESEVTAHGYPIGGETVSATSGVVSRLEHDTYVHGMRDLLVAQIDAALNPGNSGGPVVSRGKIVGVAMQTLDDSENIGYVIPAPVIGRFLKDAVDGSIAGTPNLGVHCLPIENEALREYLGLHRDQGGAIVTDIAYRSSAWGHIQKDDVLLAVDGTPIASDCSVPLASGSRIDFSHVLEKKQVGDVAALTVWRDKRENSISVT
jgi:S1-C subfamily serine protease